jgi:putative nucleotidyltransferase with HDIG domain
MKRELVFKELNNHLKENKRIMHSLAVEAAMKTLAVFLNQNADKWALAGLLHDIDLEVINYDLTKHGLAAVEILESLGVEEEIIYAIKAHNPYLGFERLRKIDIALYSIDHLVRLTMDWLMVMPAENSFDNAVEYITSRYYDKVSVKESERLQIEECSKLGCTVGDLIKVTLRALYEIKSEINLKLI